jgi:hypothetical protein
MALRVGVVGCGQWGQNYLRDLNEIDETELPQRATCVPPCAKRWRIGIQAPSHLASYITRRLFGAGERAPYEKTTIATGRLPSRISVFLRLSHCYPARNTWSAWVLQNPSDAREGVVPDERVARGDDLIASNVKVRFLVLVIFSLVWIVAVCYHVKIVFIRHKAPSLFLVRQIMMHGAFQRCLTSCAYPSRLMMRPSHEGRGNPRISGSRWPRSIGSRSDGIGYGSAVQ